MIKKEFCAAVCIDLQERIVPAMHKNEELIENCLKLINGLNVEEIPLIVTEQYPKGLGATIEPIKEAAGGAKYVEKIIYSAFPDIKGELKAPDTWKHVIVFGIESHVCVLQTAMELKEAGYQPVLVTDCISSRHKKDYKTALIRAQQEGILLTTCESVLFELNQKAGTDRAKAIQKIVK